MKKNFLIVLSLLVSVMFYSCGEDSTSPEPAAQKGSVYVISTPGGAQIWNGSTNSNKVTPDSLTGLDAGTYQITLKMTGFRDTTVTVSVAAGQKTTVNVKLPVLTTTFGLVKLWETTGTTADQPSGLSLSDGKAYSTSGADKNKVDLYYSSTGFVLASPDQISGRQTYFQAGSSTNLTDTVSSPARTQGTWEKSVKDTEKNYIFVYDNDQHYSKLQIVNRGGGTPGSPAWVELRWIYNQSAGIRNF